MKQIITTLALALALNATAQQPFQIQPLTPAKDGNEASKLMTQGAALIGAGMIAGGMMLQASGKDARYGTGVVVFGMAIGVPLLSIGLFKRGKH